MNQTYQQLRAKYALAKVKEVKVLPDDKVGVKGRFKAYSKQLPIMIQSNGLGMALAYIFSKGQPSTEKKNDEAMAWYMLFDLLREWLVQHHQAWGDTEEDCIHTLVMEGTQQQYQLAQSESMALLYWVKEYSNGFIEGEVTIND